MLELLVHQPIFIGFKVDNSLRQRLAALNASERQYVSDEDPSFLRTCRVGDDTYVGKIVSDSLTTDRVEDIRLNVLSIIRKLGHAVRLPINLKIIACSDVKAESLLGTAPISAPETDPEASALRRAAR